MIRSARLLISTFSLIIFVTNPLLAADTTQWKITSIKICRTSGGAINPIIEAIGNFPVYTFFIPRPVWTVNGTVVEAQPNYDKGRLTSFKLFDAAPLLKSGAKNTVKFSLPDQNSSKIFHYDQSTLPAGDCYEFF